MTTKQDNTHVCPWWLAYTFDNPLRRLFQDPHRILGGFVKEGQTVLDIGCGMGYFSLGLARLVGPTGKVISVDLQQEMLARVQARATQQGLQERIHLHQGRPDSLGLEEPVDFALAFWMVHEVSNRAAFLTEVRDVLKPEARFLVVEPKLHVSASDFQKTVDSARAVGLKPFTEPEVRMSRAILFARN